MRAILLFSLALWMNDAHAQGLEPETMAEVAARAAPAPEVRGILPSSIDLGALMPPPVDQGPSSACSSFAVTYAAGSAALRQGAQAQRDVTLSPALTYSAAGGSASCRGKTKISRTLDALRDMGTLPIDEYRFDPGWCARVPTAAERTRALQFRIAGWHYIDANDLRQVKGQLAQRHPVIFGLQAGPVFWAHRGDGVFATVEQGATTTGHAMVLVGYDDARQAFRLINSAGRGWGDGGYGWLAYTAWKPQEGLGFVIDVPVERL